MTDIKTIEGDFTSGKGKYALVVGRWNSFGFSGWRRFLGRYWRAWSLACFGLRRKTEGRAPAFRQKLEGGAPHAPNWQSGAVNR